MKSDRKRVISGAKAGGLSDMIRSAGPKKLRKAYEAVCDTYARRMLEQLGLDGRDAYWVADDVGGVFAYSDVYFLGMENIVLVVDNKIGYEEFDEWYTQWIEAEEGKCINLRSWIMGLRPDMVKGRKR